MQVNVRQETPRLDRVESRLQNRQYLRDIGVAGVADIKKNFQTQGQNIGREWPPLVWREGGKLKGGAPGPRRAAQRLRNDGQLMRSVHCEIEGDKTFVVATKQAGGHNIANIQHYGRKIKVTQKMRVYLGKVRGIWLKREKSEIVIPPTYFMTFSERFKKELTFILSKVFS